MVTDDFLYLDGRPHQENDLYGGGVMDYLLWMLMAVNAVCTILLNKRVDYLQRRLDDQTNITCRGHREEGNTDG